jgi:adenylate cyclase class IV
VTGPARNLELKALDPEPAATREAALALGAEDAGVLVQRDTYFHAVQGRLKLREIDGAVAELISYARADVSGPKVSHYRVVPVFDPAALAAALADALGVRVVVDKRRELLLWRDVRIHLDTVAGLGTFVEVEAVAAGPEGLRGREADVATLREALGLTDDRLVARGYADLLERATFAR